MRGRLVALVVGDLGAEVNLDGVSTLLGRPARRTDTARRRPAPASQALPRPLLVRPAPLAGLPPGAEAEVRLHDVGAVAVRVVVPFEVAGLSEVLQHPAVRATLTARTDLLATLLATLRPEIGGAAFGAYDVDVAPEYYAVFCFEDVEPPALHADGQALAALLVADAHPLVLSDATMRDALRRSLSYSTRDEALIGWDHAVLCDEPDGFDEAIDIMEHANVQLLELRVLDQLLDRRLEFAYGNLDALWARGGVFRSARRALADLSILRADLARVRDNLHDTDKTVGDWYQSKLYRLLRDRFHLQDWHGAVQAKMDSLEDAFQLAGEETNHRRALVLEAMIVLLFVLDLLLLFVLAK